MKNNKMVKIIALVIMVMMMASTVCYASTGVQTARIQKNTPITKAIPTPAPTPNPDIYTITDPETGLNVSYPKAWKYGDGTTNWLIANTNNYELVRKSIMFFSPKTYQIKFTRIIYSGRLDWIVRVESGYNTGATWYVAPGIKPMLISGSSFFNTWDPEVKEAQAVIDSIRFEEVKKYQHGPLYPAAKPVAVAMLK